MTNDPNDRIIDSCLEELLGGQLPPDLSEQILTALAASTGTTSSESASPESTQTGTSQLQEPIAPPIAALVDGVEQVPQGNQPPVPTIVQVAQPASKGSRWSQIAISASLVGLVLSLGLLAFQQLGPDAQNEVEVTVDDQELVDPLNLDDRPYSKSETNHPLPNQGLIDNDSTESDRAERIAHDGLFGKTDAAKSHEEQRPLSNRMESPWPDEEVVAFIDSEIAAGWAQEEIVAVDRIDEISWCGRVFQSLLGRTPTATELREFTADESTTSYAGLVTKLLATDAYNSEFSERWSKIWTSELIGRAGGKRRSDLASRQELQTFLREKIQARIPYDEVAFELVAATGAKGASSEETNGAVNFLLASFGRKATFATSHIARVMLGQRVDCVRCHESKIAGNTWSQQRFWELNAFLRQMDLAATADGTGIILVNVDFMGEGDSPESAEIYYEQPDGLMRVAYPRFLGGKTVGIDGRVNEVNRRTELARFISKSDEFAVSSVNRMWANLFGFGLVNPIDDIGPHNAATHPELLKVLSRQFVTHGYDMRKLMRWMLLSAPFTHATARTSDAPQIVTSHSGRPLFNHFYERLAEKTEVLESLRLVAKLQSGETISPAEKLQMEELPSLVALAIGPLEIGARDDVAEIIAPSELQVFSDKVERKATPMVEAILQSTMPTLAKIEHLFRAIVAREPYFGELRLAETIVEQKNGYQILWWVLANSQELTPPELTSQSE